VIRRLTAVATWVLLLHINLIASDLVCGQHHEISAAPAAVTQHHAPVGARTSSVMDGDNEACQVPARADCCRAMASCTVSLALGPSQVDAAPSIMHGAAATVSHDAPLSVAFAPDPPPPKA
jgi:hypothetical protein